MSAIRKCAGCMTKVMGPAGSFCSYCIARRTPRTELFMKVSAPEIDEIVKEEVHEETQPETSVEESHLSEPDEWSDSSGASSESDSEESCGGSEEDGEESVYDDEEPDEYEDEEYDENN